MNAPSIPVSTMKPPSWGAVVLLGGSAAALATLFLVGHWAAAVFGALIIVAFAAVESEPFLLLTIFLLPIGWFARIDLPLGGDAARLDIPAGIRLLVVGGFFAGRLWRGGGFTRGLWKPQLTRASVALLAVAVASIVLGPGGITYGSLKALVRLVSYVGFYLLILCWVNSRERLYKVLTTILASTILIAAFGILQEIVGDFTSLWLYLNPPEDWFLPMEGRVPSFLNYSTTLAGYLNLVLPFALACFLLDKGGMLKKLGGWTLGLGLLALACTQTRAAMVGFGCVLVLAILYFCRSWKRRLVLLAGLAAFTLGAAVLANILSPEHLTLNANRGEDIVTRFILWSIALKLFTTSPVFGIGYGNYVEQYGSYLSVSWIPTGILGVHNTYLQFLTETGLVGLAAFALLIFRAVRQALDQMRASIGGMDRAIAFGTMGAIVTVLVQGFVDFLFGVSAQFGTLFWIWLALLVVSARISEGSYDAPNRHAIEAARCS